MDLHKFVFGENEVQNYVQSGRTFPFSVNAALVIHSYRTHLTSDDSNLRSQFHRG